jgi:hypothetical protein
MRRAPRKAHFRREIVSGFPGSPPTGAARIVAAAHRTVVTEAGYRSGSLNIAAHA